MRAGEFSEPMVIAVIQGAHALFAQPGDWTRNAQGRTEAGSVTLPEADDARCWCVAGALRRAAFMVLRPAHETERLKAIRLAELAGRHVATTLIQKFGAPPQSDARRVLTEWNDAAERRWEEVALVYRMTLGIEQEREAA